MGQPKHAYAVSSLVVVMLIWGASVAITKTALTEFPPFLLALLRFVIASTVLLPFAKKRGGTKILATPRPWGRIFLMGLMGVTLHYIGVNLSLTYMTASQGALILSLTPAMTAALAYFWIGERISLYRALGIGLAVVGAGMVVSVSTPSESAPHPVFGSVLMIGSVLAWCVYTILGKQMVDADPIVATAYSVGIGTALLVPAAVVEALRRPMPMISFEGWLSVLYLGAAASAGAYFLYNRALRYLDASQVTNYMNLIPIIGVVTAVLFLGETLVLGQILGGVLVLIGIRIPSRTKRTEPAGTSVRTGATVQPPRVT